MPDLLIDNARLVTWTDPNELRDDALLLRDGRIHEIGPSAALRARHPDAEVLDARGQLVMPGNICAHTHFYGAFARGMAIPGDAPKDFPEILERLWWKLDKALTLEDVRYSALVCLVDAVKHGTTTLIDHHARPNAIDSSLDQIADAVEQAGVRAVLCYEVTDRDGPEPARAGIRENERFIRKAQGGGGAVAATFGLHAGLTLSDATLEACRAAHDGGFHIHVAEHEADEYDSLKKRGLRVVDRLARFGILGPQSIAAHCVHIDYAEAGLLLRQTGTWVTHQPRWNMNNAVGAAPVESLLRLGVPVCLGNDGMGNAMWAEWKAAYLLHKLAHRDPRRMNGADVARMAIDNNAALAAVFWPELPLGRLAVGAAADIIFVDYHAITPLTAGNLPWHLIFGFESSMVTTTIVGGRVLMRDRQLLTLDEEAIAARSRELAVKVWRRFEELSG